MIRTKTADPILSVLLSLFICLVFAGSYSSTAVAEDGPFFARARVRAFQDKQNDMTIIDWHFTQTGYLDYPSVMTLINAIGDPEVETQALNILSRVPLGDEPKNKILLRLVQMSGPIGPGPDAEISVLVKQMTEPSTALETSTIMTILLNTYFTETSTFYTRAGAQTQIAIRRLLASASANNAYVNEYLLHAVASKDAPSFSARIVALLALRNPTAAEYAALSVALENRLTEARTGAGTRTGALAQEALIAITRRLAQNLNYVDSRTLALLITLDVDRVVNNQLYNEYLRRGSLAVGGASPSLREQARSGGFRASMVLEMNPTSYDVGHMLQTVHDLRTANKLTPALVDEMIANLGFTKSPLAVTGTLEVLNEIQMSDVQAVRLIRTLKNETMLYAPDALMSKIFDHLKESTIYSRETVEDLVTVYVQSAFHPVLLPRMKNLLVSIARNNSEAQLMLANLLQSEPTFIRRRAIDVLSQLSNLNLEVVSKVSAALAAEHANGRIRDQGTFNLLGATMAANPPAAEPAVSPVKSSTVGRLAVAINPEGLLKHIASEAQKGRLTTADVEGLVLDLDPTAVPDHKKTQNVLLEILAHVAKVQPELFSEAALKAFTKIVKENKRYRDSDVAAGLILDLTRSEVVKRLGVETKFAATDLVLIRASSVSPQIYLEGRNLRNGVMAGDVVQLGDVFNQALASVLNDSRKNKFASKAYLAAKVKEGQWQAVSEFMSSDEKKKWVKLEFSTHQMCRDLFVTP